MLQSRQHRAFSAPLQGLLVTLVVTACTPAIEDPGPAPRPPARAAPPAAALAAVVDSILDTAPLHRTHWGIAVVDATTGEPLLLRQPEKLFITASNMKLVTVAAALARLGPEFRFETELLAPGTADGIADSLVVRGTGDPTFSVAFFDRALAPLDSLADSLVAAGVTQVDGPLVVDQGEFDETLVHPAWERFDIDWYYAAPVAPLAVSQAAVPVVITPTVAGSPARVEVLELAGLVGVDAEVMTVPGADTWNDELVRVGREDSLILRGTIGAAAGPDTSWVAQTAPGAVAGRALRMALERAGVQVEGAVVVRGARTEPNPAREAATRVAWRSPPLSSMLHLPLLESDNWVSEQLLKTLGAEVEGIGGWSEGTAVAEEFLRESVGIPADAVYMRDGSGLSAQDLITPRALVDLLLYVQRQPWGPLYRDALAEPGETDGTLEDRLLDHAGRLHAKTGTIRHVNSLSGYAVPDSGSELIFSILTNGSGLPSSTVRAAMDTIVSAIIEHGS